MQGLANGKYSSQLAFPETLYLADSDPITYARDFAFCPTSATDFVRWKGQAWRAQTESFGVDFEELVVKEA